jgi:hypothetical protein
LGFDITSIIATVFTIIIYPLLPTLAHGQQEQQLFPFSYTTTKNQISDDIHSGPTTSHAFSSHDKNAENSDANANDNDNVEVDDNNNDNTVQILSKILQCKKWVIKGMNYKSVIF